MVQGTELPHDSRQQNKALSTATSTVQLQCGLPDVVQEVPHLVRFLDRNSRSALSSCNRQLRHILHSYTTLVVVKDLSDLQILVRGYWPQLSAVILSERIKVCPQAYEGCNMCSFCLHNRSKTMGKCLSLSQDHNANLQLVAVLDLWETRHDRYMPSYCQSTSKCSLVLVRPKAQQQQQVGITYHSKISDAASSYPSLKCSNIQSLHWSQIDGAQGMAELVPVIWQSLTSMKISSLKLGAIDVTCFVKAPLLQLCNLDLSQNHLDANSIEVLVSADLPNLGILHLQETRLDASAAMHLAKGKWPDLLCLYLSGNLLDDTAMLHVAAGQWSFSLKVECSPIAVLGFQRLTKGRWPELESLIVVSTMISTETLALLDVHAVPTERDGLVCVSRDLPEHDPNHTLIWPSLDNFVFRMPTHHSGCPMYAMFEDPTSLSDYLKWAKLPG